MVFPRGGAKARFSVQTQQFKCFVFFSKLDLGAVDGRADLAPTKGCVWARAGH